MGGPGEFTAEASKLLALKTKLQIQLGDHHGEDINCIARSKMSRPREPSVLCPLHCHQGTFPKKFSQVEWPGALHLWRFPQMPLWSKARANE